MNAVLDGGFADPVLHSQVTFRAVMDALANPGIVQKLVTSPLISSHLSPELASIMLTLTDHDTSIWLDEILRADRGVLDFIGFHAGATLVDEPDRCAFGFASAADRLPPLDQFNLGSQEYPDRSTTIVLAVPSLDGGSELVLRGPGIKEQCHCSPTGLPGDFVAQWAANRELFPRGVDLLLVANGEVMGLPRSMRIGEGH